MRSGHKRRGAVLIVVLGILVVLSLLGTTFAVIQRVERSVSRNYMDGVRARWVARAGVEYALAMIGQSVEQGLLLDPAMQYWGDIATEEGAPSWIIPLENAINPSYAVEEEGRQNPTDPNVIPRIFRIDDRAVGISGTMGSGSYSAHGDVFRLRVSDANSRLHINDGIENGNEGNVSRNLARILDNLGNLLEVEEAGRRILERRPPRGYRSVRELEFVLGPADYRKIGPFLTAHAWQDPDVANPVPLSRETLTDYPVRYNQSVGVYRYGRSRGTRADAIPNRLAYAPEFADPAGAEHAIVAMDEINAQYIEIVRRAPVNINLAPKEILTALIMDLRGFFVVERRMNYPGVGLYSFLNVSRYDFKPGDRRGDEYGYLYSTAPFTGEGSGTRSSKGSGVSASKVAEEIVACRNREASPNMEDVDYATLGYGGVFRTWRQFNAFCDGLVEGGLIEDDRNIFFDWDQTTPSGAGTDGHELRPSPIAPKLAAQAMADVLKANFNPNLTLNELNPDRNLHLLVDKTDLISNTTEFCLTPMGVFSIESEGLVVQAEGGRDLYATKRGRVLSRSRVRSVVRRFDAIRHTTQAQFYEGELKNRPSNSPVTNNNKTLELGPEPDNSILPQEARWGGRIQLATVGGHWGNARSNHEPGSFESTRAGSSSLGATIHAHFTYDHTLNFHAGGARDPMRPGVGDYRNNADRTESVAGPYSPARNNRYRSARAWTEDRLPPNPKPVAVGDLRMDGAYVERDSALMYMNGPAVFDHAGTVSYWIKPSYRPEMTGRARTYFTTDAYGPRIHILGQWFLPAHDAAAGEPSRTEGTLPAYADGPWRPMSMAGGFSARGGVGVTTDSLNHTTHPHSDRENVLVHHEWVHVTFEWDKVENRAELFINGVRQPGSETITIHPSSADYPVAEIATPGNPIRLGEPSSTTAVPGMGYGLWQRNWPADATIDEFHLWKGRRLATAVDQYRRGRYHVPRNRREGEYTSAAPDLKTGERRSLAPPSPVSPPGKRVSAIATPGGAKIGRNARILAVAWTLYPETVDRLGVPHMRDRGAREDLEVKVEFRFLRDDDEVITALFEEAGSPVGLDVGEEDEVKYRIVVSLPDADVNTILHATPVIDDVTIYFSEGAKYLNYSME